MRQNSDQCVRGVTFLGIADQEITLRPKFPGELYPGVERLTRILVRSTVHCVRRGNPCVLVQARVTEAGQWCKQCPGCQSEDWDAWMPVSWSPLELQHHGSPVQMPEVRGYYIVCVCCGRINGFVDWNDPRTSEVTEYIYDPAEDLEAPWMKSQPPT